MTDNFGIRSPHNPFLIGEFVNIKRSYDGKKFYNAQYNGQLSPYDIKDNNPLLLFTTFEGNRLRVFLKAIQVIEFDVPRKQKGIGLRVWASLLI